MLDFIVVGAQKAGTTSLFKYLSSHPQICMPPEKEAHFFGTDERYLRGMAWYMDEFFSHCPPGAKCGSVTPQYFGDVRVPERLSRSVPEVRLIAVLRDPVERAYSHYRMSVRRGLERRTFERAVEELLNRTALGEARTLSSGAENEERCYIVWGEYGRLLRGYLEYFDRGQLLVLYTRDLALDPAQTVRKVFAHIGVQESHTPPELGARFNVGGDSLKIPWLSARRVKQSRFGGPALQFWRLLPRSHRRRISYWFEQWNIDSDCEEAPIDRETRERLYAHFRVDLEHLMPILLTEPPWFSEQGSP